jgi:hypothetical protein
VNRKSVLRPSPGLLVGVVALVLAATPIADATTKKAAPKAKAKAAPATIVAHAKYADNADEVNNYKASIHPTPDTLLPLGPNGQFPASVLPASSVGATGPQGPQGPQGPAGPAGLNSPGVVTIVYQANGTSTQPSSGAASATCAPGTKVLGGGFNDLTRTIPGLANALPAGSVDEVDESDPFANSDGTSGWQVRIVNVPPTAGTTPGTTFFQAFAICGG